MSSSVKVWTELDNDGPFTNLEYISGKVHMKVMKDISVENVQIKLEGTSETRLLREYIDHNRKKKTESRREIHELLYDVDTLFPPDNVKNVSNSNNFTLVPGDYEYDFLFQFPLWAQCSNPNQFEGSNFLKSSEERTRYNSHKSRNKNANYLSHSLNPLPPSMSFAYNNGSANIANTRYFLKVTVRRTSKFSLNTREIIPLEFGLFDPEEKYVGLVTPLPEWFSTKEIIIQQSQDLNAPPVLPQKKRGFLQKIFDTQGSNFVNLEIPIQAYGYLKSSYVCSGGEIQLCLSLMTKMEPSMFKQGKAGKPNGLGQIYIEKLSVSVHVVTRLTADGYTDHKTQLIKLADLTRVAILDLADASPSGMTTLDGLSLYRVDIPEHVISTLTIPDGLVQTFETCNISRFYGLIVDIVLSGSPNSPKNRIPVSCHIPFEILSGIHPPEALRDFHPPPPTETEQDYIQPPQGGPVPQDPKALEAYQEQLKTEASSSTDHDQLPSYHESTKH